MHISSILFRTYKTLYAVIALKEIFLIRFRDHYNYCIDLLLIIIILFEKVKELYTNTTTRSSLLSQHFCSPRFKNQVSCIQPQSFPILCFHFLSYRLLFVPLFPAEDRRPREMRDDWRSSGLVRPFVPPSSRRVSPPARWQQWTTDLTNHICGFHPPDQSKPGVACHKKRISFQFEMEGRERRRCLQKSRAPGDNNRFRRWSSVEEQSSEKPLSVESLSHRVGILQGLQ